MCTYLLTVKARAWMVLVWVLIVALFMCSFWCGVVVTMRTNRGISLLRNSAPP